MRCFLRILVGRAFVLAGINGTPEAVPFRTRIALCAMYGQCGFMLVGMGLLDAVRGLFQKKRDDDDVPYSIVLLLKSPFAMTEDVLSEAASRAFGVPYEGSDPMYFVSRNPLITAVKAGPALITVLEANEPYLGDPAEVATGFGDERLSAAWREHRSWVAFDLQNWDMPKKQAYRLLASLAAEVLDARCVGVWLPKDSEFTIQSDGSAAAVLERLKRA